MSSNRKSSLLETSHSLAMFIMILVILGSGVLIYFKLPEDDVIIKRDEKLKNIKSIGKGIVIDIEPIQEISIHFEGNSIFNTGRKVKYEYYNNSSLIIETDTIEITEFKNDDWRKLMKLKIGDSIRVGIIKNGNAEILLD